MHRCKQTGCTEYRHLTRRQFIGVSAATAAAVGAPMWLPRVAYAGTSTSRDVIITIFLRGGADGLSLCVPHGDDDYYSLRPNLNIPRPDSTSEFACIDLDGFFGIPRTMRGLRDAYNAGDLLLVHATGSLDESRSHFQAMNVMETGKPLDPSLFTGWVGRHLMSTAPLNPNAILRAIGINSALQRSLAGSPLALPVPDLSNFGLDGWEETMDERIAVLAASYAAGSVALQANAANTITTFEMLEAIGFETYEPSNEAQYPDTYFGTSLKSSAALIKAGIGVEAIAADLGGWDTHAEQQPRQGYMANLMQELADSLGAFHADMAADSSKKYVLVVMSEFGRIAYENGTGGTDHGHGSTLICMGNHIDGGRVLANWPGLGDDELFQGQDLQITIDYRDILSEIVQNRLGNTNLSAVFPEYTPIFHGVTTT
ncbi:MAG TPA: DUF1501 domain-containing protein [Candidatus Hydrogenedentes bacterium]|nr:DUF1501 domain-containing protein [Candidatus Hydrogenedentota bacterium]